MATDTEIEVEDRGETLTVPTNIDVSDLSAWYGNIPDEIRVDRVFRYDGIVRVTMWDDEPGCVEAGYFREEDFRPGTETGWVAERIENAGEAPDDKSDGPGETLWTRD